MSNKKQKFLDLALKRLKRVVDAENDNRKEGIEDLKFLNGEQWDPQEKQRRSRTGRPVLQVDLLSKFVDQVVGDERHNRPRIKVRPEDSVADVQIANIRQGLISNIEYQSNAESIYDQAFEQAVSCGYGAWRVLTRYTEENPFIQEIYLERIKNPFLVYMDPDAKDLTYMDANWGFILTRMSRDEYEEKYPKSELPGDQLKVGPGMSNELWYNKETVTLAEYFVRKKVKTTYCQMEDGTFMTEDKAKELLDDWDKRNKQIISDAEIKLASIDNVIQFPNQTGDQPPIPATGPVPTMGQMPPMDSGPRPTIVKRREADRFVVKRFVISAIDVLNDNGLEGEDIPGKYIPLVLLKGKERNIEGKDYVRSLIRNAKDPQRLLNYWNTSAAEVIALQPKSPWLGTPKMFEGFENDYALSGVENYPFLQYNIDPDAGPGAKPTRQGPGEPPVAMFTQISRAESNIEAVIGMSRVDVGGPGPERTGQAVIQKQKPGDIGTYAFYDNLCRCVGYTGRIINEMIPEVYDTERDVRIRRPDDTETFAPINTTTGNAIRKMTANPDRYNLMNIEKLKSLIAVHGDNARFNEIGIGRYSTIVTAGPSYATQRQESVEYLLRLTQALPKQMGIAADLLVQNMDFRDADELATRLRKMLPPGMLRQRPGEPPSPPLPPPPQAVAQQKKVELEMKKIELMNAKIELEKIKVLNELGQSQSEMRKLVLDILTELHAPDHVADNIRG